MQTSADASATLIGAGLAAAVAIGIFLSTLLSGRRAEQRAAHRNTLAPFLPDLGRAIHETIASSDMLLRKAQAGKSLEEWPARAKRASDSLKAIRLQVRYPLFGIDDSIRTLTRLPDWIATYKGSVEAGAAELLSEAKELGLALDAVVRKSYATGLPPTWIQRRRLSNQNAVVRHSWDQRFGRQPDW